MANECERLFRIPTFFVFRTALLPFDAFLGWGEERGQLGERLRSIVKEPDIQEALFVASPDLHDACTRWLDDADSKKGKRLERTLLPYFSRMCGRSTPFGLFAGYSMGEIGQKTRLTLDARQRYQRHTRLDMNYVFALIDALAKD